MPNWVNNRITVSGSPSEVERFEDTARKQPNIWSDEIYEANCEMGDVLSFANFIAPPQEAVDSGEYWGTHGFVKGEAVGRTDNNWYEFNTREWDTKWDAGEVSRVEISGGVEYGFQTAWSPPEPVFEKMTEMFPKLTFDVWWEEEQGYGAEFVLEAGEVTSMKKWDIPSSHQDYVDLDRADECVCSWQEPDGWFSDCGELTEFEITVTRTLKVKARSEQHAKQLVEEVLEETAPIEYSTGTEYSVTEFDDGLLIESNQTERTE